MAREKYVSPRIKALELRDDLMQGLAAASTTTMKIVPTSTGSGVVGAKSNNSWSEQSDSDDEL